MIKIFLFVLLCSIGCSTNSDKEQVEVYFSPNGGALSAIVKEINAANSNIRIQAYSFTHPDIGEALIAAHKRNVKIEIILDRENLGNPHSLLVPLYKEGIDIFIDGNHAIAHNKIMIIDNNTIISGSFNFTRSAQEKNAENSLIIHNEQLTTRYISNWQQHKSHSPIFQP